ncbi:MAG TPA: Rieske (2Fe-2S) protein [Anaerolineae bacterium]|jgi:nitrite reductase/ring-hydroxylating ferredoxin subunit
MLNRLFNNDIPEREDGLMQVSKLTELAPGKPKKIVVKGQPVVLVRIGIQPDLGKNDVVAFSAICPHALGDLSQGWINADEVDCPVHYYRFNMKSGECTYPRGGPHLRLYPITIEGNSILIKIEKPKWQDFE